MSGIISVGKPLKLMGVSLAVVSLAACSQMQKHSNMLVFGTNTSIGLNVGKDASQTPTVQIGVNRQELALVPLLANTKATQADGNSTGQDLEPCDASPTLDSGKKSGCHFVAKNKTTTTTMGKDGKTPTKKVEVDARDSYSTLASFGTRVSASQGEGDAGAVAVAQYFATGVAAQELAAKGGANVILADSNSGKKAEADAEKAKAEAERAKAQAINETESGVNAALKILGGDPAVKLDVTSGEYKVLEAALGAGCDQAAASRRSIFTKAGKPTMASGNLLIGDYLAGLRAAKSYCFDELIKK